MDTNYSVLVRPGFASLINVEALIPAGHPATVIPAMHDGIPRDMSGVFDGIYA